MRGVDLALIVVSATVAAIAGAMQAYWLGFVSPSQYSFHQLVIILAMVIVGGVDHWSGPLLGAFVFTVLPEVLRPFGLWSEVASGVVLLVIVIAAPRGIAGSIRSWSVHHRGRAAAQLDVDAEVQS